MNTTEKIIPFQRINFTLRSIFKDNKPYTSAFNKLTHIIKFVCDNCPEGYKFLEIHGTHHLVGIEPITTYTITYISKFL